MKNTQKLLNLLTAFLAVIGACIITANDAIDNYTPLSTIPNESPLSNSKSLGWVKTSGLWYYYDSVGKVRTSDLVTDVMTFKFDSDTELLNLIVRSRIVALKA